MALRSGEMWVGFTVGLIGTAALPLLVAGGLEAINPPREAARRIKTLADLRGIRDALELFSIAEGRMPTTDEGLSVLVRSLLDRLPVDPWGKHYIYRLEGTQPHVASHGSDGQPGGRGATEDLDLHALDFAGAGLRGRLPRAARRTLILGGALIFPVIALVVRDRPLWAVGVIAGSAAAFAVVALSLGVSLLSAEPLACLSIGIGVSFAAGSAVVLRTHSADGIVVSGMALLIAILGMFW